MSLKSLSLRPLPQWTAFVFLAASLPFVAMLSFDFLKYDDGIHLYENPWLSPPVFKSFLRFFSAPMNALYIPTTYTFWGLVALLSAKFSGELFNPVFFHGANLLLHGANSALVFAILYRLYPTLFGALSGALLFAWHPLHVEPVAWVSGAKDLLATFFMLLSILSYLKLQITENRASYLATLIFGCLALGAKPSAMVLPWILLVFHLAYIKTEVTKALWRLSPLFIVSLAVALLTKNAQPDLMVPVHISWGERGMVAVDALLFYLRKSFFPFSLTLNYGRTPEFLLQRPWLREEALALVCVFMVLILSYRRKASLAAMGLFLIALLPSSGLVLFYYQRFSTVADRFAYFALFGFSLWVSSLLAVRPKRVERFGVVFLWAYLALVSISQSRIWFSDQTLLERMVQLNGNAENHFNLAQTLTEEMEGRTAIPLHPWRPKLEAKVGEQRKKALALIEYHYSRALAVDPSYARAYHNLGVIRALQGDWRSAESLYLKAVQYAPALPDSYNALGVSMAARGEREKAREYFQQSLALSPQDGGPLFNLGLLQEDAGRWKEALQFFESAFLVNPLGLQFREKVAALRLRVDGDKWRVEP